MPQCSKKRVTMRDIAKHAGVSKAVVWAALNQGSTSNIGVASRTKEKILKVAQNLNYIPDIRAKSLATKRSYMVGLLGREAFKHYMLDVLAGVQDTCFEHDYSVVTYFHGDTVEDEASHIRLATIRQLDALILMPALDGDGGTNAKTLLKLSEQNIPVVQILAAGISSLPSVCIDNFNVGYMATRYLIEKGHRHIGHVTHADYMDIDIPGFHNDSRLRYNGYCKAMDEAGLEKEIFTHSVPQLSQKEFSIYAQKEVVPQILSKGSNKPTAIFACNDYVSFGLLHGLYMQGIRVPDDISLVSFDGLEVVSHDLPTLTSLKYPLRELGQNAARLCFEYLDDKSRRASFLSRRILLQPELREGQTVRSI